METFLQTITRIGSFLICARLLMHFRPDGSYEKYLKFLVSMMVLAQLLLPVLEGLKTGRNTVEIPFLSNPDWKLTETVHTTMEQDTERILEEITLLQWRIQQEEMRGKEEQDVQEAMEDTLHETGGEMRRIESIVIEPIISGGTSRKEIVP